MDLSARMALAALGGTLALTGTSALAIDWSDTSLGWRYGKTFAEPFNPNDISKQILNLTHVNGYAYGSNFFNADFLFSDRKEPADPRSSNGARETYVVYRHLLDLGKVTGLDLKAGPLRSVGVTAGFDLNTKDDVGYNSRKRMVVFGPSLMFDVPGFLNVGLLGLWESNAPSGQQGVGGMARTYHVERYRYDTHPALDIAWGIPLRQGFSFEGYALYIARKGKNEFGGETAAETNIDMKLLYDFSSALSAKPKTFRAGFEYQYWRNKFGNDHAGAAGRGAFARTPMVRLEYHF